MATARSYVQGPIDVPLLTETIGETLRRTVERFGDREALVACAQGYRATYRELWDTTTTLAKALLARGINKGDRVGIWAPNRFEWVIVQYATARIGAILVNVNPAYKARELEYALNQSGLRLLLHSRGFRKTDYRSILGDVRGRCPKLQQAVVIDDEWAALLREADSIDDSTLAQREANLRCKTRSTSSTRPERPVHQRGQRSPTTTSSTTAISAERCCATPKPIVSVSRYRSITASAW